MIIIVNVIIIVLNHSITFYKCTFLQIKVPFQLILCIVFTSVPFSYVSSQYIFPACVCLTACYSLTREGPSLGSDGLRCSPWEKQMSSLILKITFKVLLLPGGANHWPGWDRKQSAFKLKPCNFSSNHQRSYQTHTAFMPAASGIFE